MLRVRVARELVEEAARTGSEFATIRILKGIPPGARLVDVQWHFALGEVAFYFEHPDYPGQDAVDVTVMAEKQIQPRWIPVEERLPERDEPVLLWDGVHQYEGRLMQWEPPSVDDPYEDRFHVTDPKSFYMIEAPGEVTHWQALPPPPAKKEGAKEDHAS